MHPQTTEYRLASTPYQYKALHALRKASESPEVAFGFPTVYAVRDGVLMGFLGTLKAKDAIVAGPLVIDPTAKAQGLLAMRLVEAYEEILTQAGVTSYIFGIDKANASWRALVEKRGFTPYADDDTDTWYIKEIR